VVTLLAAALCGLVRARARARVRARVRASNLAFEGVVRLG
jgi:hypothetical protein